MVKIERSPIPPASLAVEKKKGTDNYRGDDVVCQLDNDFHGKCYLCETHQMQSVQTEHLKVHRGGKDRDRMFDWNNLFLSCAHCNNVKNQKRYEENVLDCCRQDPEKVLSQRLIDGHVEVDTLNDTESAQLTADLITECFEKCNTGIRILECHTRINALNKTMTTLYRTLQAFKKQPTSKNRRALSAMLKRSYKFAGFTRTYVREHIHEYPELADDVAI